MEIYIWILLLLILILTVWYYWFSVVSIMNSHLGDRFSAKEADNEKKETGNFISEMYRNEVYWNLKNSPFQEYVAPEDPPTLSPEEASEKKFLEASLDFTRPVVIKGLLKDSNASQKWSLDYFAENYGDLELPVVIDASIEMHKKYIKRTDQSDNATYMTIKDIMARIGRGEKTYINNVSRIFGLHPELVDDLELEHIEPATGVDMKNATNVNQLFFGGKGTGTSLHSAITGNFFVNIKGRKHWYLIDPIHTNYMLPSMSRTGLFAVSHLDICGAKKGDYALNIPRYEVVLEEGDVLYNPPWWWHAIANESDYTIACANRYINVGAAMSNNLLYSAIFASHPIANYYDFWGSTDNSREDNNMLIDKALVGDIMMRDKMD
jgi:Cupin-like domain